MKHGMHIGSTRKPLRVTVTIALNSSTRGRYLGVSWWSFLVDSLIVGQLRLPHTQKTNFPPSFPPSPISLVSRQPSPWENRTAVIAHRGALTRGHTCASHSAPTQKKQQLQIRTPAISRRLLVSHLLPSQYQSLVFRSVLQAGGTALRSFARASAR